MKLDHAFYTFLDPDSPRVGQGRNGDFSHIDSSIIVERPTDRRTDTASDIAANPRLKRLTGRSFRLHSQSKLNQMPHISRFLYCILND